VARTVAYLTPLYFDERSYLGGGERYPLNLARGVVEAGAGRVKVELISFGQHARRLELAPGVGLRVLPIAGKVHDPLDVTSWDLPDALAEADLVHIHQVFTRCAELGMLVAKQQGKPVVVSDHGGHSSPLGAEAGILDLADRIVAYSYFGASMYGRIDKQIDIIKGGVDASTFVPPPNRLERDRILYVGRLLPHKGIDRLIAAMPSDLPLTVCGRPYHAPYYKRLQSLAIGKNVTFVTDADDELIKKFYWRSWANVLPSVHVDCYGQVHRMPELMGFTLLEAMACGSPAICARTAAMPEFIRQGETGFVYEDLDELEAILRRLASSPGLSDRMGDAARADVIEHYDLRVAGRKMLGIYDELLARGRREVAA